MTSCLPTDEYRALQDISDLLGDRIPIVPRVGVDTFGAALDDGHVVSLNVSTRGLGELPDSIAAFSALKYFDVENNELTELPGAIGELRRLEVLCCARNRIQRLDERVGGLERLRAFKGAGNRLASLPASFARLASLRTLDLDNNDIEQLPDNFGELRALAHLNLGANQLMTTQEGAGGGLGFKKLRLTGLDPVQALGGKENLHDLPDTLLGLQAHLLGFRYNRIAALPESFGSLTALESFTIVHNCLTHLPETFGDLSSLRRLNLRANRLESLPASFSRLTSLEELDLRDNKLLFKPEFVGAKTDGNPFMFLPPNPSIQESGRV